LQRGAVRPAFRQAIAAEYQVLWPQPFVFVEASYDTDAVNAFGIAKQCNRMIGSKRCHCTFSPLFDLTNPPVVPTRDLRAAADHLDGAHHDDLVGFHELIS